MIGTLINAAAVLVGGGIGTWLGRRFAPRVRDTVQHGLGLVTMLAGVQMALETENILLVMGSLLVGGILGEWWRLDERLSRTGDRLKELTARRVGSSGLGLFTEGFVTASLVFCVGPMTVLGAIQDGLTGDYTLLAIKSMLDGFASLVFASTMGIGVLFSILTILVFQGAITLAAGAVQAFLTDAMIAEMTAAGGVIIIGIALLLLDLKRIHIASFLPALAIAPLLVWALGALGMG
jgi:uncharacterized protein